MRESNQMAGKEGEADQQAERKTNGERSALLHRAADHYRRQRGRMRVTTDKYRKGFAQWIKARLLELNKLKRRESRSRGFLLRRAEARYNLSQRKRAQPEQQSVKVRQWGRERVAGLLSSATEESPDQENA
jgi:hypothetical protein